MKVIVIAEKDAANISLGKIVTSFVRKGHETNVYMPFYDKRFEIYFMSANKLCSIKELTMDAVTDADVIFCSTLSGIYLPEYVFSAKKPVFTHNYLMNRQINWGGDLCFVPSKATVASDYDEYLNYSYIGIGEPKYDSEENKECSVKRFLFIDSGHYPFSMEGKRELARTLLHICKKYPDYELWIKPRFLPDDKVLTHRNSIHLYDVIWKETDGDLPDNMAMLTYHEDLKRLVNRCSTVICMYSTAFVSAIVGGKGLIILDNLQSTDVYDIRHKTYMRCRENMLPSGALIDYRKVDELLPDGVKGTQAYLDFLLEEKEHVADKVTEVCEYLWDTFYKRDLFPKRCDSTYKRYKEEYIIDETMTWERQISCRFHDYILLKSLILIDFHVSAKLDISYILQNEMEYEDENGLVSTDCFRQFLGDVNNLRDNCIICNREIMLQDEIDAGVLLNAYYLQKRFDEIRNFPITGISAYNMFRAFTAMDDMEENAVQVARENLDIYFSKCKDREYNLEISDMPGNRSKAYEMLKNILKNEKIGKRNEQD